MVSGRWKVVLTQTAFPCPVRSDQRNRGKETSGSDFRCSNGSRCPARLLFSRYLCSVEILLVVWDSRSGSWWVEWLRWGGLGEGFVVRVTCDRWPGDLPKNLPVSHKVMALFFALSLTIHTPEISYHLGSFRSQSRRLLVHGHWFVILITTPFRTCSISFYRILSPSNVLNAL